MSRIAADNYYMSGVKPQDWRFNITAKNSFENERLVAISSYTPGGAGDLNINAGRFYGDAPIGLLVPKFGQTPMKVKNLKFQLMLIHLMQN